MKPNIWWSLGMKFHRDPWPGHSVGKARECAMCREFVCLMNDHNRRVAAAALPRDWLADFGDPDGAA